MAHDDDTTWVRSSLAGDGEAFAVLVERHAGWLLARLACQLGDRSDAEDLVQESLLAAFDQLAELKDPVRFAGWLAGIADNKLRMWHRRRVVQLNLLEAEPACEGPGPVGESPPVRSLVREPWRG